MISLIIRAQNRLDSPGSPRLISIRPGVLIVGA
jgi:hypothetical protein